MVSIAVCWVTEDSPRAQPSVGKTLPVNGRKAMYHWVLCKALDGYVDFRPSNDEMETMAAAGNMTVQQVETDNLSSLRFLSRTTFY